MKIHSFMDIISTDPHGYHMISLHPDEDEFNGKLNSYICIDKDIELQVRNCREAVIGLRDRIASYVNSHKEIILIVHDYNEIFTSIKVDSFFFRLASNTGYSIKQLDVSGFSNLLDRILPIPEASEKSLEGRGCTLS